jgi:hypothetical protein
MDQAGQSSTVHQLLLYGTLNATAHLTDRSGRLTSDFLPVGTVPNFIVANAMKRYKDPNNKVSSYVGNHRKSAKISEKSSSKLARIFSPTAESQM